MKTINYLCHLLFSSFARKYSSQKPHAVLTPVNLSVNARSFMNDVMSMDPFVFCSLFRTKGKFVNNESKKILKDLRAFH